jgi:hypothetical protein
MVHQQKVLHAKRHKWKRMSNDLPQAIKYCCFFWHAKNATLKVQRHCSSARAWIFYLIFSTNPKYLKKKYECSLTSRILFKFRVTAKPNAAKTQDADHPLLIHYARSFDDIS